MAEKRADNMNNPIFRAAALIYWNDCDPMGDAAWWDKIPVDIQRRYVERAIDTADCFIRAGYTIKVPPKEQRSFLQQQICGELQDGA